MKITIEGNIVFPTHVAYGQLSIQGDLISDIRTESKDYVTADHTIRDGYISPGFIDIQINGAFGKEFKTDIDALEVVSNQIFKFGTTSFCPTITTTQVPRYLSHAAEMLTHYSNKGQSRFLGFHFEGPMLNPKKVGAQNSSLLKQPKEIDLTSYLHSETRIVTLAPELEGGPQLITELLQKKVKVGIGHSMISFEQLNQIFDDSNMVIVHLYNAMEPLSSREPGVIGVAIHRKDAYTSLIVDGNHLHPVTLGIVWRSKENKDKLICISDGSAVTGLAVGVYKIGERTIQRLENKAILPDGTLVGSILTLNVAARNLMQFVRCTVSEAINTVSLNPARFLGLENTIGQIKEGNKADILIIDSEFNVLRTFINGVLRYNNQSK